MDWSLILSWSFFVSLILAAIRLALPVLCAILGEIITELSGVSNLGMEGVMAMGGVCGFLVTLNLQKGAMAAHPQAAIWIGLLGGMVAGALVGLLMAFLAVTMKADQTVCGVTLVLFGVGLSNYLYRQSVSSLSETIIPLPTIRIPLLSSIPVLGPILFEQNSVFYFVMLLVILCSVFLNKTVWGMNIRAVGENPAAAETSGVSVEGTRYAATILGAALAGLGGSILTIVQLGLFNENIIAGKGWVAVALVIFARWKPGLALVGALLFGAADAFQYRIQAITALSGGTEVMPYEFLLMLPYLLTIGVLLFRNGTAESPATLGRPYTKGER